MLKGPWRTDGTAKEHVCTCLPTACWLSTKCVAAGLDDQKDTARLVMFDVGLKVVLCKESAAEPTFAVASLK